MTKPLDRPDDLMYGNYRPDDLMYGYFPIVKHTRTPDGLLVEGRAAGPGLDLDGQGFNADYLKTAVPDWFRWGNVREQHQQIAAGVGKELVDNGDGSFTVKALIVDPVTVKKVETGILKGFSPGVKNGRIRKSALYPNGEIYAGEMIELSLVDRPSHPDNIISICKSAGGTFQPVDSDGNLIETEGTPVQYEWLSETLHKSASATLADVYAGEFKDADEETARTAVIELCDLGIAELMMLKSAVAAGKPGSLAGAAGAVDGLTAFIGDGDEGGYPGMIEDFEALNKSATTSGDADDTVVANLVKAAVAEATEGLRAQNEALSKRVAEVEAMPVPGGPMLVAPPYAPTLNKSASAGGIDYAAEAQRPGMDPRLSAIYAEMGKEGAH